MGLVRVRNYGVCLVLGCFVVFVDDDCCFCKDWLSEFEVVFEYDLEVLVGGCIDNVLL